MASEGISVPQAAVRALDATPATDPSRFSIREAGALSRDAAQREVNGKPADTAVVSHIPAGASPDFIANAYREVGKRPSLIDQSAAELVELRRLRTEHRTEGQSIKILATHVQEVLATLSNEQRSASERQLGPAESILQAIRIALTGPVASRSAVPAAARPRDAALREQHAEEVRSRGASQRATVDEDEEEALRGATASGQRSLISRCLGGLSSFARDCWRFVRELPTLVGRLVRSLRDAARRVQQRELSDGGLSTVLRPVESTQVGTENYKKTDQEIKNWTSRFGDEPQEGARKTLSTVAKVLEEIAAARVRELDQRKHEDVEQQETERARMNTLREALARLLVPFPDGVVPLVLLSKHFVGPWVTDDDLRAAIERARQSKALARP